MVTVNVYVIDWYLILSWAQIMLFVYLYFIKSFVLYKTVSKSTPGFETRCYLERSGDYGQPFLDRPVTVLRLLILRSLFKPARLRFFLLT